MWVATGTADYIFYQQETTAVHQNHIIMHEIGHIMAGHCGSELSGGEALTEVMPSLSPAVIRRTLQRTGYEEEQEREAELFATVAMELLRPMDLRCAPRNDGPVDRMATALGSGPNRI